MQKPKKNHKKQLDSAPRGQKGKNQPHRSSKFRGRNPSRSRGTKSHIGSTSQPPRKTEKANYTNLIWGLHAVKAALLNPKRKVHKLVLSENAFKRLNIQPEHPGLENIAQILPPTSIDHLVPEGAAHQGAVIKCTPLEASDLDELHTPVKGLILVLDQITDPHNVGAMFRLAKAFGARGLVMQNRGAPPLMGATAKVAVGTIETVPHVLVTNIANTLLELQKTGWRVTGLAGETDLDLTCALKSAEAEVIVMGAEGPGLRPRVRKCCDQLARIPMPGGAESLNVATAAAIALYEAVRQTS